MIVFNKKKEIGRSNYISPSPTVFLEEYPMEFALDLTILGYPELEIKHED